MLQLINNNLLVPCVKKDVMLKKMEKTRWLTFGMLILVLTLFISNFGSAYSNIIDFKADGIELRNVLGADFYSNYQKSQSYCYGFFGSSGSNNDACACDSNGNVVCCDSIKDKGIWVKNLGVSIFSNGKTSISCSAPKPPQPDNYCSTNGERKNSIWNNFCSGLNFTKNNTYEICEDNKWVPKTNISSETCNGGTNLENQFCQGDYLIFNWSQPICSSNGGCGRSYFTNKTSCKYGCSNGDCNKQPQIPISNLTVNITNPLNNTTYISDKDIYEIDLNVTANQTVQNWSVNGSSYVNQDKNLNIRWNITLGENTIDVCGTNENGTSCDSVVVYLLKETNNGNGFWVNITSPEEGKIYDNSSIWLNISSENTTKIWYNWNGTNVNYSDSILIYFPEGNHTIHIWGTNGTHIVYQNVTFEIKYSNGEDNGSGDDGDGGDDGKKNNGCKNCVRVDSDLEENTIISLGGNNTVLEYHSVSKEKDSKSKFKPNFIWTIIILVILILIILILLVLVS